MAKAFFRLKAEVYDQRRDNQNETGNAMPGTLDKIADVFKRHVLKPLLSSSPEEIPENAARLNINEFTLSLTLPGEKPVPVAAIIPRKEAASGAYRAHSICRAHPENPSHHFIFQARKFANTNNSFATPDAPCQVRDQKFRRNGLELRLHVRPDDGSFHYMSARTIDALILLDGRTVMPEANGKQIQLRVLDETCRPTDQLYPLALTKRPVTEFVPDAAKVSGP